MGNLNPVSSRKKIFQATSPLTENGQQARSAVNGFLKIVNSKEALTFLTVFLQTSEIFRGGGGSKKYSEPKKALLKTTFLLRKHFGGYRGVWGVPIMWSVPVASFAVNFVRALFIWSKTTKKKTANGLKDTAVGFGRTRQNKIKNYATQVP